MAPTVKYYDLVLIAIAASVTAGALIGALTPVPLEVGIVALGLVAIAFIGHALFINGPVDDVETLTEEVEVNDVPQVLAPVE